MPTSAIQNTWRWLCLALILIGCGVEVGNPKDPKKPTNPPVANVWIDDDEASEASVTAQVDEALFALSETPTTTSTQTGLTAPSENLANIFALVQDFSRETSCEEDADSFTTSTTLSGTLSSEFNNGPRRLSAAVTYDDQITRKTTSPDADALRCSENGKRLVVDRRNLTSLTQTTELSRNRSRTIVRLNDGRTVTTGAFSTTGNRKRVLTKTNAANPVVIREEISYDITRSATITTRRSGEVDYSSRLFISADNPLIVTTAYRLGRIQARRVSLKDYEATLENGTVVRMTFDNLTFQAAGGCTPLSGVITGSLFANDAAKDPSRTFEIDFDTDETPLLVFDESASFEFSPDFCRFE